jgi:hypothetical protein
MTLLWHNWFVTKLIWTKIARVLASTNRQRQLVKPRMVRTAAIRMLLAPGPP